MYQLLHKVYKNWFAQFFSSKVHKPFIHSIFEARKEQLFHSFIHSIILTKCTKKLENLKFNLHIKQKLALVSLCFSQIATCFVFHVWSIYIHYHDFFCNVLFSSDDNFLAQGTFFFPKPCFFFCAFWYIF